MCHKNILFGKVFSLFKNFSWFLAFSYSSSAADFNLEDSYLGKGILNFIEPKTESFRKHCENGNNQHFFFLPSNNIFYHIKEIIILATLGKLGGKWRN